MADWIGGASSAFSARYGMAMDDFGLWNETLASMLTHRTVRAFRSEPLPEGIVETLVAAAQSAPTSSNLQSWSVLAVVDPARKARLAEWSGRQAQVIEAPLLLIWLADLSRAERLGEQIGRTMEALPYAEAQIVAMMDASFAAQNALVAAESLGLGACYLGALRNHPEWVAAELGLPPRCFPVFGLCVGWPDEQRPAVLRPRLPQSVVLHRERYDVSREAAEVALYDGRFAEHQRETGLPQSGWVARVMERLATVAGLNGRDIMRGALARLGFTME